MEIDGNGAPIPKKKKKRSSKAAPANVDPIPIAGSQVSYLSELGLTKPGPIRQNAVLESEYVMIAPVQAVDINTELMEFVAGVAVDKVQAVISLS